MHCPTLSELPPAPVGKTGWPWTEETPQLADVMPGGIPWSRVSIVTPSYNQEQFIEETIRSVLLQGYPNLEYIIIDGGSTDNSIEIIKKYEKWLAYWVSERDKGQADAVNKGWKRSTGEILAWLNSDDTYLKATVNLVVECLHKNKDVAMVYADINYINESSAFIEIGKSLPFDQSQLIGYGKWHYGRPNYIGQQTVFLRSNVLKEIGFLDSSMYMAMDYDLYIRIGQKFKILYIPHVIANQRLHRLSKTSLMRLQSWLEVLKIIQKYGDDRLVAWFFLPYFEQVSHIMGVEKAYNNLIMSMSTWDCSLTSKSYLNKKADALQGYAYFGVARLKYGNRDIWSALQNILQAVRKTPSICLRKNFILLLFHCSPFWQIGRMLKRKKWKSKS